MTHLIDTRIHDAFHPYKTGFSDEQLYWLGWMASDGCVYLMNEKYFVIKLKLGIIDKEKVEQFKKFIGARKTENNCKSSTARIVSNYMGEYLIKLGITERKSYTLKVDNRLAQSTLFWRGMFEGDGCLCWDKTNKCWQFSITSGSYQLLQQWCNFINLSEDYIRSNRNHYQFIIAKKSEVLRIIKTLYHDLPPKLRLERKWQLIDECLCELDTNYLISQLVSLK